MCAFPLLDGHRTVHLQGHPLPALFGRLLVLVPEFQFARDDKSRIEQVHQPFTLMTSTSRVRYAETFQPLLGGVRVGIPETILGHLVIVIDETANIFDRLVVVLVRIELMRVPSEIDV